MFPHKHVLTAAKVPKLSELKFSPEIAVSKEPNTNRLCFQLEGNAHFLLDVISYEKKNHIHRSQQYFNDLSNNNKKKVRKKWLQMLQSIAYLPSGRLESILFLVRKSIEILTLARKIKTNEEENIVCQKLSKLLKTENNAHTQEQKAIVALMVKDRVAEILREYIANPVRGFLFEKKIIVDELKSDDEVVTPVGVGLLRGFRPKDNFCLVVFPWGNGFIHRSDLKPCKEAIELFRKRQKLQRQQRFNLKRMEVDQKWNKFNHGNKINISSADVKSLFNSLEEDGYEVGSIKKKLQRSEGKKRSLNDTYDPRLLKLAKLIENIPPSQIVDMEKLRAYMSKQYGKSCTEEA